MDYDGHERRSGEDRRSGSDRRDILDLTRPGPKTEKRGSIIDRRSDGGRRSSDLITIDELERMR